MLNEAFVSATLRAGGLPVVHTFRTMRRRPWRLGQVVSIASAGRRSGLCILMSTEQSLIRRRSDCSLVVESWSVGGEGKGVDAVPPFCTDTGVFL